VSAPTFFATQADWRAWLEANHTTETELSVGFWKVGSGKSSVTWPQSVDEALCFGWIDAVRHRIDDDAYRIRFTRRRDGGNWSQVNLKRFAELAAEGRVAPAGYAAQAAGVPSAYSYEREADELAPDEVALFRSRTDAWRYFRACPPGYRKQMIHRITAAKRPETRARRLAHFIDACAAGRRMD